MRWSDLPLNPAPRALRQFSSAWLVFFVILGWRQYFWRGHPQAGLGMMIAGIVIGSLGLAQATLVRWLFVALIVVGFPLGWCVTQIALVMMFLLVISPVAVCFRLCGHDPLGRRPAPERPSFWVDKTTPQDIRRYFRQY
jgi:hypothetical protein